MFGWHCGGGVGWVGVFKFDSGVVDESKIGGISLWGGGSFSTNRELLDVRVQYQVEGLWVTTGNGS